MLAGQASVMGGGTVIVIVQLAVFVPTPVPVESTTWAVNVNGPPAVGVPVMAPVTGFNVNSGGRLPDWIEYVNGGTPPPATSAEA